MYILLTAFLLTDLFDNRDFILDTHVGLNKTQASCMFECRTTIPLKWTCLIIFILFTTFLYIQSRQV
ncbi:hypothetical protein LSH36_338g06002, partial [Paralvinella palmiformis]